MAVLAHEGTYPILYSGIAVPVGAVHRDGYLARPDEAGLVPVVFVIPGLDGLTSFERDTCRRLARSGFAAITVDLYGSTGEGLSLYNSSDDDDVLIVLDELHQFLMSEDVGWNLGEKVGLLASDVGGRFALIKAATRNWVSSIAIAYTPLTGDEERLHRVADYLSSLPVAVLAMYGTDDDLIDVGTVDEAQRRNDHGQWLLYDQAEHGFLDPVSPSYDEAAADDAFARIVALFSATLPAPQITELG